MIVLITGGARSGKSRFAEQYAAHLGTGGLYVATAEALDDEMRERISAHKKQRQLSGFAWETVEAPLDLSAVLQSSRHPVILVDCLTLWLSNWLLRCGYEENPEALVQSRIEELVRTLVSHTGHILLVSNEVGSGVVPEYPLGRLYRDLAGMMNQQIAAVSDQVFLVTAGIPVELKSLAFRFPDKPGKG
jgi:adenosylcobinamide kinase/adenosylcobinamide-phosphate guanylyltransferase